MLASSRLRAMSSGLLTVAISSRLPEMSNGLLTAAMSSRLPVMFNVLPVTSNLHPAMGTR